MVAMRGLAHYGPPAAAVRRAGFGASPSGKAADFDSAMRRFESSRPSHINQLVMRLIPGFNGAPFLLGGGMR